MTGKMVGNVLRIEGCRPENSAVGSPTATTELVRKLMNKHGEVFLVVGDKIAGKTKMVAYTKNIDGGNLRAYLTEVLAQLS